MKIFQFLYSRRVFPVFKFRSNIIRFNFNFFFNVSHKDEIKANLDQHHFWLQFPRISRNKNIKTNKYTKASHLSERKW